MRLRWAQLAVADSLTYRQIRKTQRSFESREPSLVLLQTCGSSVDSSLEPCNQDLQVSAKRVRLEDAVSMLAEGRMLTAVPTMRQDWGYRRNPVGSFDEYGVIIHDFERSLFQADFGMDGARADYLQAENDALSLSPTLPVKIVDRIMKHVREESPLERLTDAPLELQLRLDPPKLEFHALTLATAEEHEADVVVVLNEEICGCDKNAKCVIYPWKATLPATRRDFWRLYRRIINYNERPIYMVCLFFDRSAWHEEKTVVAASWYDEDPAVDCKMRPRQSLHVWRLQRTNIREVKEIGSGYDYPQVELSYGPNARFFRDLPAWKSRSRLAPPVFFLTNCMNAEEVDKLKLTMRHNLGESDPVWYAGEDGAPYVFVPWVKDGDGDPRDMWDLFGMQCQEP